MAFTALIPIELTVAQSIFVYIVRTEFYKNQTKVVENTGRYL